METTNENNSRLSADYPSPFRQLLEMLDNPDAYSEQEIMDIINRDEETREAYRMMVEAKRSSRRQQQNDRPDDVDAAWQRFSRQLQPELHGLKFMKVAAVFIGVLMFSGIVYAAVHFIGSSSRQESVNQTEETQVADNSKLAKTMEQTDSTAQRTVVFEDAELSAIIGEMAAYYHLEVEFQNNETKHTRLYFTWDRQQSIDEVIETFNRFERIHIQRENQHLTVR